MKRAKENRLRVVRAIRRTSQLDVALAVGMSQTKLSMIENRYIDPTAKERAALARALKVTEGELFPEDGAQEVVA